MTAVITVATMAGPLGFIAAGYALGHVSLDAFFIGLPVLLLLGSLGLAAALLRGSDESRFPSRSPASFRRQTRTRLPGRSRCRSRRR